MTSPPSGNATLRNLRSNIIRFHNLAISCTVLIISHRLTTTMQADTIHIMQNGQITKSGTHEELLKQQGRYHEAWKSRKKENL